ncbi:hypothetical protein ACFWPU_01160 [Streptomyces sp. NPDC058471]|uniref:hypothetical protein n=1 Tax=Streptomyces sp. NPDC058471 TaxID=3346516 RepID=UPI0036652D5F
MELVPEDERSNDERMDDLAAQGDARDRRMDDLSDRGDARDVREDDLTKAAKDIVKSITILTESAGGQLVDLAKIAKRNRLMIWALAATLTLSLVLTGFVVHLTNKVDRVQETTRSDVLCPLYQQFINADTPLARERAKQLGQDMAAREEAYKVIHEGYGLLGCRGERQAP